jgi:PCAF (P300/CBP-associated factor) N-terminal domain
MKSPRSPPPSLGDYPNPPAEDPRSLSAHQQLLLVARHSHCLAQACTCRGWKPRPSKSTDCSRCGHGLENHGMQEVEGLDEEEKDRRVKVASRIDELLNVRLR